MKPKAIAGGLEGRLYYGRLPASRLSIGTSKSFGSTGMGEEAIEIANTRTQAQRSSGKVHTVQIDEHERVLLLRAIIYIGDIPRREIFVHDAALVELGEEGSQRTRQRLIDLTRASLMLKVGSREGEVARDVIAVLESTQCAPLFGIADRLGRSNTIGRELYGIQQGAPCLAGVRPAVVEAA